MKVDTNSRGNTIWFMFKVVGGFKVGQKYKFNILNFSRNLDKFYNQGMNVCTKLESRESDNELSQFIESRASLRGNSTTNLENGTSANEWR